MAALDLVEQVESELDACCHDASMHARTAVALLPFLAACFDNLSKTGDRGEALATDQIDPISFDAVYVINGEAASISVIDAQKNAVAATITLHGVAYPHRITVSPDRQLLGIAVPGFDMSSGESGHEHHSARAGQILLLDASTGALVASKGTDAANVNVAFGPDGRVWTSQATQPGSTLVLGTKLDTVSAISVGTSPAETAVAADGSTVYVANSGSSSVSVIDVAAHRVKGTISVGAGPTLAQPGPNGRVYVQNEVDQTVSVVDAATLNVEKTLALHFRPGTIMPTPNGQIWIAAPERGGIEVRDEGGTIVRFVATGPGAQGIVLTGDGTRAFVSNELDDSVSVVDVATLSATTKIPVGARPNGLAWRPANAR